MHKILKDFNSYLIFNINLNILPSAFLTLQQDEKACLKAFFIQHLSEYESSDSSPKVNPKVDICDRISLIGLKSGQLGPIYHFLLEES